MYANVKQPSNEQLWKKLIVTIVRETTDREAAGGPETGGKRVPSMGKRPAWMEISLGSLRGSRRGVEGKDLVTHGSHGKADDRMLTVSILGTLM